MIKKTFLLLTLICTNFLHAVDIQVLQQSIAAFPVPVNYNAEVQVLPGQNYDEDVLLSLHGMGGSCRLGSVLRQSFSIPEHIVCFNFPDANHRPGDYEPEKSVFGTPEELITPLYLLHVCVNVAHAQRVFLYGFSAGGGAAINLIATLRNPEQPLFKSMNISAKDCEAMLQALLRGGLILDTPLKSVEEIISFRGSSRELEVVGGRYRQNQMVPIEVVKQLNGLPLNVLLFFQDSDTILSNLDDTKMIEAFYKALPSQSLFMMVRANDGSHNAVHPSLWQTYEIFTQLVRRKTTSQT